MHATGAVPAAELIARASDHALNERVRVTAMNGLATTPSPEAAAFLADLLARGDTAERANAAILVGHQDLEIAVPALIRALGDSSEQVRANAAESLGPGRAGAISAPMPPPGRPGGSPVRGKLSA